MSPYRIVLILLLSLLGACSPGDDAEHPVYSDADEGYPLGTRFAPAIFAQAFHSGHRGRDSEGFEYELNTLPAGDLLLPSGRIVIDDPLYLADQEPLQLTFAPGRYPVTLAELSLFDKGKVVDQRNALVKITLAPGQAVVWEYIGTFGTDGATGGYIDAQTMQRIIADQQADAFSVDLLAAFDKIYRANQALPDDAPLQARVVNLPYGDGNLIAFSTGFGDGGYNSYLGRDADGKPVEILTDFWLVEWDEKEALVEVPK